MYPVHPANYQEYREITHGMTVQLAGTLKQTLLRLLAELER